MPEPMMPPITIMVASKRPRRLANPEAGWTVDMEGVVESTLIFFECGELSLLWPSAAWRHSFRDFKL